MHKQYVIKNKQQCVFVSKGTRKCQGKKIYTSRSPVFVETYSCNDADRDCMMSNCHICHTHGLAKIGFSSKNNASTDTSVCESESGPNAISHFSIVIKIKVVS